MGRGEKREVALRVRKEFDKNKQKGLRIAIDSHHLLIARKVTEMDFLFKFSNLFQRFSFLKICKNTKRWWEAEGLFFFSTCFNKEAGTKRFERGWSIGRIFALLLSLISTTTTKKTLLQMCVSVCALTSRKT
jgi:hypothetical protein